VNIRKGSAVAYHDPVQEITHTAVCVGFGWKDGERILHLNNGEWCYRRQIVQPPIQGFRVTWRIDLPASDAREAAKIALAIMRDPASLATCFTVEDERGRSVTVDFHKSRRQRRAR
jgi:hypothetical protein